MGKFKFVLWKHKYINYKIVDIVKNKTFDIARTLFLMKKLTLIIIKVCILLEIHMWYRLAKV